jgi:hypothetical protein
LSPLARLNHASLRTSDDEFTDTKVVELYCASWQCVQRNGKRFGPLWKEKRRGATYNSVTGRHYYHPNMLRSMPRLDEGSEQFLEWMNARVRLYVADDFGADPEKLVEKAVAAKDVVRSEDPMSNEIIGRDALDEMRSKRKKEEDQKRKREEEERERVQKIEDEKKELLRKMAEDEERKRSERLKVDDLDYLLKSLSMETITYHAAAIRKMPVMNGLMFAADWFGETFGLESEDDCVTAFQFARKKGFVVEKCDDQGTLEHFRGAKTKTPAA